MNTKMIFGYGSLIREKSLRVTAPNATDIQPAYIKGFRRDFSLLDPFGYTEQDLLNYGETSLDLANIPFCGLDIKKIPDPEARVNGVVFTVSGQDLEQMMVREAEYKLVKTIAYDYPTEQPIGICEVFSAGKNNAKYDFNSAPLKRYLEIYLQAGKRYGDKYYQELLSTTFINDQPLTQVPQLAEMIRAAR